MEMKRIARGKNILYAGYDPVAGILAVQFAKSGVYKFTEFPEAKWVSLQRSPFPDRYFSTSIKGKHPVIKPEKVKNGNTQDTQRRDSDSGNGLPTSVRPSIHVHARGDERPSSRLVPDGRRNAGSAGGKVVEVYRPEDGVTFTEEPHAYYLNGKRVPFSLTQVLELSGISRQPTEPSEIAARPAAAKRGTKVHEYTLWSDQGELEMEDLKPYPDYFNRVMGWQQFREDFKFEPDLTACEIPLVVVVNGMTYAMKLDALGTIGEGDKLALAVIEKKCTVSVEASYAIQTAGQAIAFKQRAETLELPLKRFVVQLSDKMNGAKRYYNCVEHTDRTDERIFLSALATCHWRLNHKLLPKG